jgi:hypothetical protein
VTQQQQPSTAGATVPAVLAWPAVGVLVVFIAAWLYEFAGRDVFAPWWLLGAVPVFGLLGGQLAAVYWPEARFGVRHERAGRWFAWVAAAVAGAWLTWAGFAGPGRALPLLVLGALPVWLWFVILCARSPSAERATDARYERGRQLVQDRSWRTILDRAGCEDVVMTEVREHRAGLVLTLEPDPAVKRTPSYEDFAGRAKSIATQAALHYRRTGTVRLPRNAVRTEPGADDAEFLLHVSTRDVFAESTKYVPDYQPGDITNALDLGEYEDAARLLIALAGHMKIVGATGSGKSVLANNLIGRITACSNALVWVGATDKLVPLVWPWLRPFFEGTCSRPVVDYVAGQSIGGVLKMLRAAYRLASERNARLDDESKMRPTSGEPAVFVVVEEVSHGVEFTDTIRTHDGQDCTVPDLIKMIGQAGRSANVWLVLMSQFGINAALGDRAAEIIRNITMRVCLRTLESHDGYRTLPGLPATVDTTKLTNHTMYVQPSIEVSRAFPAKAPHLDGADAIAEIAVRQSAWRPAGVEPESHLGSDYARRWDADELPELADRVARRGWTWRVPGEQVAPPQQQPTPVGVDTARGGPDDGGDMPTTWGPEQDAELTRLLGGDAGAVDADEADPTAAERLPDSTRPRPFDYDPSAGLDRLRELAAQMGTGPGPDAERTDDPAVRGRDLPEPVRTAVRWLRESGLDRDVWVRTAVLAESAGTESHPFGLALARTLRVRSANLPREFDPEQRKGYRVRDVLEAADRYRFGMP